MYLKTHMADACHAIAQLIEILILLPDTMGEGSRAKVRIM